VLLRVSRLRRRMRSFVRHKSGDRGSRRRRPARRLVRGTTWNFSQRLPRWFEATRTRGFFKRVCGSYSWGFLRCAVLGRRSILAESSARGCVAGWDWRLMGQCCVFRQLHTDLATGRVLESRATAPLPPKSGGGWWLAGEGARCLIGALMRTLFWGPRAGRGSNPCPGFYLPRTDARVTCSRVSDLRDFALVGSVSGTVVPCLVLIYQVQLYQRILRRRLRRTAVSRGGLHRSTRCAGLPAQRHGALGQRRCANGARLSQRSTASHPTPTHGR